jgi:upstream activation factor subunit UAF30
MSKVGQPGFGPPVRPTPELAEIIGDGEFNRGEVAKRLWDYIKARNLQNPRNRREIIADDKLRRIFGKDRVTMFEMNELIQRHLI